MPTPLWGAPRIHGELLKLGIDVGQTTVAKYMARTKRPPSQGWKTFLVNHADGIASMDLFVVPTISFRLLYGFLILLHARRELLWLGVTAHPTAEWIAQQDSLRRLAGGMRRDTWSVIGTRFTALGLGSACGPWAFAIVRSRHAHPGKMHMLRGSSALSDKDCLDHVVVFGESHLRNLLRSYQGYYNEASTHLSLCKDAPLPRAVQAARPISVVTPILGGLHHRYWRI